MVKICITFKDVKIKIPSSDTKIYPKVHTNLASYIVFGFNDSSDKTKRLRLQTTQLTSDSYIIESKQSKESLKWCGLLCELLIPIQPSKQIHGYQIHGKELIGYLDELHYKTGVFICFHERGVPSNKYGSFTCNFHILSENLPLEMKEWPAQRKKILKEMQCLGELYKKNALKWNHINFGNTQNEKYESVSYPSFFGERPIHSYLYIRPRDSNEKYWLSQLGLSILVTQTYQQLKKRNINHDEYFFSISDKLKHSIVVRMFTMNANSCQYAFDFRLDKNGKLTLRKADYYSSNTNEGLGDCDDGFSNVDHIIQSFLDFKGEFDSKDLRWIRSFLQQFIITLTYANTQVNDETKEQSYHAVCTLVSKRFAFSHLQIIKSQVDHLDVLLEKLEELEKQELATEFEGEVPNILVFESITDLYPYPLETLNESPVLCTKFKEKPIDECACLEFASKETPFIGQLFLFVTTYFLDRGINLPALHVGTSGSKEKGRLLSDFYLKEDSIVLIPQAQYNTQKNTKEIVQILRNASIDHFPYYSFIIDEKNEIESCSTADSYYSSINISREISKNHEDELRIPDSFEGMYCVYIQSYLLEYTLANIEKEKLVSYYFWNKSVYNVSIYIIWLLY